MSWLSENYEKAAIGGAAVLALAFGYFAYSGSSESKKAYNYERPPQKNDVSVSGLPVLTDIQESLGKTHEVHPRDVDGRKVGLFTGVNLFVKKGELKNPIDLLKSSEVHAGMANRWFLENNIDIGFADSPLRDKDKDGFNEREEHDGKTDPNDVASHPNLIEKLNIVGVKSIAFLIKPSDFTGGLAKFKIQNTREVDKNKMGNDPVKPGDRIVFLGKLMKERFKYLEQIKKKDENGIERTFYKIEDLKPTKAKTVYTVNRKGRPAIIDNTATFSLDALDQAGNKFEVEEGARFSLPHDEKAAKKPYLLKKIDRANKKLQIEYADASGKIQLKELSYR